MTTITKRIAKAFLTIAITGIILIPQTIHAANNQSQNVISSDASDNVSVQTVTPAQPTNLKATSRTESTIHLIWDTVTPHNAERWLIQYRVTGTTTWQRGGVAWYTNFTVEGLSPYTQYDFRVYAEAGSTWSGTWSLPSNTVTWYTLPAQPTNLRSTSQTDSSVHLKWDTATPHNADRWLIQYRATGATTWQRGGVSWYTNFTVEGLSPYTQYDFRVYSENGSTWSGTWSASSNIVTQYTLPAQPTNLRTSSIKGESVHLNWDTVTPHNTDRWLIQYKADGGSWTNAGVSWYKNYTVSGLTPTTSYSFRVYAESGSPTWSGIHSEVSNIATATTLPATPTNLTVSDITDSSVWLSWETVTPHNTERWLIQYKAAGGSWVNAGISWNKSYKVTGLASGTSYSFRVYGEVGSPSWSGTKSIVSNTATAATTGSGLTAAALQAAFDQVPNNGDYDGVYGLQCVDLYLWFVNNYTTLSAPSANGKDCVSKLANKYGLTVRSTPTPYSIFSTASANGSFWCNNTQYGHTGVVVSVNTSTKKCTILHTGNSLQNTIPRSWITEVSYDVDDVVFVDLRPYLK